MSEEWLTKAVGAIVTVLLSWGTWITARSFGGISREEHERLCQKRQEEVDRQLDRLEKKQDETLSLLIDIVRERG